MDLEELKVCLRVLQQAHTLPADDPRVLALEQAAAGLRKKARAERRRLRKQERTQQDREVVDRAHIHVARANEVARRYFGDASKPPAVPVASVGKVERNKRCYICKAFYDQIHGFYAQLCPKCAPDNYQQRFNTADLTGRRALITGGRIKIGFVCALKLLRDGAEVVVTTRFPKDAARRFAAENDFRDWSQRLQIYGLDLRDIHGLVAFTDQILQGPPVDIIIHNAAQTIQRPPIYYQGLAKGETMPLSPDQGALLPASGPCEIRVTSSSLLESFLATSADAPSDSLFPAEVLDIEGKPLDLRAQTSWRQRLHEVHPAEAIENWVVGGLAPFVMNGRLRNLMMGSHFADRYIVNVSAVEGQFAYSNKTAHHPHTNMTKAALNMMTRTCGQDYAKDGIYMTCVDTGWVTDENAEPVRARLQRAGFQPPLDVVDGAARIYHPIVQGVAHQEYLFGVFLKDYKLCAW